MQRLKNLWVILALTLSIGSTMFLFSCGGGGGGGTTITATTNGMISGTAIKGPLDGSAVTAFAINNGIMGAQIGSGNTDAQGNFNISIEAYSGSVMLQVKGGTYTDEATGKIMTMQPGDVMTSVIPSVTAGSTMSGVLVTPLTSMAQARAHNMTGGMTEANITAANTAVGTYFMVSDILHTLPMNPLMPRSGTATGVTQDMKNYGMAIAAMSQYASTIGMPFSSGIITAMMNDASDGVMDGKMGSTSIAMGGGMMGGTMMQATGGTSGLATAMNAFIGSAQNQSGLNTVDMSALFTQLNGSSGQLQGAGGASVNGMVSGTAVMGPVSGGAVTAFAITNGIMGAQLASAPTDAQGNFTMTIGSYAGSVMLQISGGTYADLATGTTMTMLSGDVMTSVIPSITAGSTMSGIHITPLTSMAQAWAQSMASGMTATNITAANTGVGNYFTVSDILLTQPMDPTVTGSGTGATPDMKNYGMTIAAVSQEAKDLGMPHSSGMVTAMMKDASDGVMNGMMGSTTISMSGMGGMGMMGGGMMSSAAGTSGLATAMTTFINNAAVNKSGLTTADTVLNALIQKLTTSNGTI